MKINLSAALWGRDITISWLSHICTKTSSKMRQQKPTKFRLSSSKLRMTWFIKSWIRGGIISLHNMWVSFLSLKIISARIVNSLLKSCNNFSKSLPMIKVKKFGPDRTGSFLSFVVILPLFANVSWLEKISSLGNQPIETWWSSPTTSWQI